MKKLYIMGLCVVISLQLFLLSGCGMNPKEQKALGRYIETAIAMEEAEKIYQPFMVQLPDGNIQVYGCDEQGLKGYSLSDDLSLQPIETEWSNAYKKLLDQREYTNLQCMGVDSKGNLYGVFVGMVEGYEGEYDPQYMRTYIGTLASGEIQLTELVIEDDLPYIMPTHMEILENGDYIFGSEYSPVMQFKSTGEWVRNYGND